MFSHIIRLFSSTVASKPQVVIPASTKTFGIISDYDETQLLIVKQDFLTLINQQILDVDPYRELIQKYNLKEITCHDVEHESLSLDENKCQNCGNDKFVHPAHFNCEECHNNNVVLCFKYEPFDYSSIQKSDNYEQTIYKSLSQHDLLSCDCSITDDLLQPSETVGQHDHDQEQECIQTMKQPDSNPNPTKSGHLHSHVHHHNNNKQKKSKPMLPPTSSSSITMNWVQIVTTTCVVSSFVLYFLYPTQCNVQCKKVLKYFT